MINPAKQIMLQGLDRVGYRLLKKEEHELLLAAAAEAQQAVQTPQSDISPSSPFIPVLSASSPEIAEFAVTSDADLASFLDRVKAFPIYRLCARWRSSRLPSTSRALE
jgi:hypothetical protein